MFADFGAHACLLVPREEFSHAVCQLQRDALLRGSATAFSWQILSSRT